jgi:hypothetical protein
MNWKLIFLLSLLGLAMAAATVSLIPQNIEWVFWLVIFIFSAWMIVRQAPGKFFTHGFVLGLANCVWIVAVHVAFVNAYLAAHPDMAKMSFLPYHPRWSMIIVGPLIGAVSGVVIGLIAILIAAILKKRPIPA